MNQFKIYPLIGVSILALLIVFSSCQGQEKQNRAPLQTQKQNQIKEALIDANKQRMLEEVENINNYVDRHQLIMKTTPTGIRIMTIKEGTGPKPKLLSDVSLKYKINLLDGSYVYSSDSSGVLSFIVGQSSEPSGLQEALLSIHQGEKALVIIPYYLAYGLTGDGDKIGGGESLVYQVELIKVRSN